jgi:fatty-acyl-CoA synthase
LIITGRKKDMIRSGGENIYPAELENVLSQHQDVRALAVVAVPDAKYLEVGCAVVVSKDPAADQAAIEASLRELARQMFAGFKQPRYYVVIDEMPVNATGKVSKLILRERFASLGNA